MNTPVKKSSTPSKRRLGISLLLLNLVVMLFPPIHLTMASGNMALALTYFLASPIILIVSLFILFNHDARHTPEVEE